MSYPNYIPTPWKNDQDPPISAQNLNKIEDAIKLNRDAIQVLAQSGSGVPPDVANLIAQLTTRITQLEQVVGSGTRIVLWKQGETQPASSHGNIVIRYTP